MNNNMPHTPLSTRLSKSTRETEIRIRNIFSGPKKRPPIWVMVLTVLAILLCGNLVAFRLLPAQPAIVMETQYYDRYENYIEIPALALPVGERNDAVDAINAALQELRQEYEFAQNSIWGGNLCLFYPSTTDRYINLVFFLTEESYGYDGLIRSWTYDKKEGVQVTVEDALALAGTTQEELFTQLEEMLASDQEDPRGLYPETSDPIVILGFRIKKDGKPVIYLSAFVDALDMGENSYLDEWYRLYVWEDGEYSRYYLGVQSPLVPAEETNQFDPPLWNQWYFSGGEPDYSPAPAATQSSADLRAVLLGNLMFTDADTGLVLDISRVTEAVTSDAFFTARPARFACVDLDWDGTEEVVLWLETEEGDPTLAFLVLRWQEGRVFSYLRFPRTLEDLKQDGIYFYSLSGAEFGVSLPHFVPGDFNGPDRWESEPLLRRELVNGDWDRPVWYYGGGQISEADFNVLYQAQQDKPDAVWYNFDPENIEQFIM